MLVRMLGQISGLRCGKEWPAPGDTIDVPEDEALQLVGQGNAVLADEDDAKPRKSKAKGKEKATVEAPENTSSPENEDDAKPA